MRTYLILMVLLMTISLNVQAQSAKDIFEKAKEFYYEGDYPSSIYNLDRVINILGKTNARVQYYKVLCYYQQRNYFKCNQEIQKFKLVKCDNKEWIEDINELYDIIQLKLKNKKYNSFADSRDGNKYVTIEIGNQIWMAENLAFKSIRGCWPYNNDSRALPYYGYLYTWQIAKNACPSGWKLPSKNDFEILFARYGSDEYNILSALILGGESGFNALLAGYRNDEGEFYNIEFDGAFWTSEQSDDEYAHIVSLSDDGAYIDESKKVNAASVRCIKR